MKNRNSYRTDLRWPRQQRGFALLFVFFLVTLLAAMAIAVDIGRLYLAQRTLQQEANIAALDAARVVSQCNSTQAPTVSALVTSVEESLERNGVDDPDESYESWTVEHGTVAVHESSQYRQLQLGAIGDSDAVRVTLQRQLPAPIMPFLRSNPDRPLSASATAQQSVLGSFFLGTGLLNIDTANSELLNPLLSGLLGGNVSLSAADYNGLLSVGVSLEHLALALGFEVQDLSDPLVLSTQTPVLSDLLDDLAGTLSSEVNGTVVNLLQDLAAAAGEGGSLVPLGEIISVVDSTGADVPVVDLLSLITALGLASQADENGLNSILLSGFPTALVNIPGVATVQVFLKVLEPPTFSGMGRPGEAMAKSAQMQLGLRIEAGSLLSGLLGTINSLINSLVSLLGGIIGLDTNIDIASDLNIGIDVDVGAAEALLERVKCPRANDPGIEADVVADSSVVSLQVGTFSGSAVSMPPLDESSGDFSWELARVQVDATNVCIGVNLLGLCIGIPVDLGESDLQVGLEMTSLGVGTEGVEFDTFDQFAQIESETTDWLYAAHGRPGEPPVANNPQTAGSTAELELVLGLVTEENGSGLTGSLVGLVNEIVDTVIVLVDALISVVNGLVVSLIQPLLELLGVQVGSVMVNMNALSIDQPHLVSTSLPVEEE